MDPVPCMFHFLLVAVMIAGVCLLPPRGDR